ncbi:MULTISPECIES: PA2779 family protein [Halorhodospira]|uniref:PA2779 family protein n=1 Tax=Halorhodospira TaxID=85108 RepID=UPI001EE8068C|nr:MULTISPECIES: PA2779 family protein [Halorhodospira]MCG5527737.1 PA2779 family protein [Halorhodospira halophila]MCG5542393.1 PA2779 family protein [Halorhodospira sp. 9628]
MKRTGIKGLIVLIGLALSLGAMAPTTALAGVVGTSDVISERQAASDRDRVQEALQREDVQQALTDYGVDPAQAEERVAALSDEEARELAERIDQQPAGAGVSIGATTILLLVIIWLLVR